MTIKNLKKSPVLQLEVDYLSIEREVKQIFASTLRSQGLCVIGVREDIYYFTDMTCMSLNSKYEYI